VRLVLGGRVRLGMVLLEGGGSGCGVVDGNSVVIGILLTVLLPSFCSSSFAFLAL